MLIPSQDEQTGSDTADEEAMFPVRPDRSEKSGSEISGQNRCCARLFRQYVCQRIPEKKNAILIFEKKDILQKAVPVSDSRFSGREDRILRILCDS